MSLYKRKIEDVVRVTLGHTFRKGLNLSTRDGIKVVQVKDINEHGDLLHKQLDAIDHKFSRDVEFASKGDVIFCPREHKLIAALIEEDLGTVVVSAPLILFRVIDRSIISPSFLQAYFNSPQVINQLKSLLMGSFIQTINKTDLMEFQIPIPSLVEQEQYAKIYKCSQQERKIRDKLSKLWSQEVSSIINQSYDRLLAI